LAWTEYFTNAEVIGIDILDARVENYKTDKVNFILSDISAKELKSHPLLKNKKFDIIIDDGSHYLKDVMIFLKNYLFL
jgi:precorrin-6B methylase 2